MAPARSKTQDVRRQQIVDAAVAVITEQGLQNLSLSEIETKACMSRGQLTYYFKSKEEILLAVFDRLLQLTYQRLGTPGGGAAGEPCAAGASDWVRHLLEAMLTQPPLSPEFNCLQYTFLAQIGHRADFRRRLATLYEEWRGHMAEGLRAELARRPGAPAAPPRALASLVQALLHGLTMQLDADPDAFDREEMLRLCLDVLRPHLGLPPRRRHAAPGPRNNVTANGSSPRRRARHPKPPPRRQP
jgi:AcrR family transcriptional regulator